MNSAKTRFARIWPWVLGLIAGLFGCEQPTADLTDSAAYAQHGIFFKHPKNWTIDAEAHPEGFTYIDADTGGSAVFLVLIQTEEDAPSLLEYATDMSEAEALHTPPAVGMKVSSVEIDASNNNRATQKMSINVLGVTVPHQIEYRRLTSSGTENKRVAFLKWQTAVDDAHKTAQGAAMIFDSFTFTP
jgi:hypothetical protein